MTKHLFENTLWIEPEGPRHDYSDASSRGHTPTSAKSSTSTASDFFSFVSDWRSRAQIDPTSRSVRLPRGSVEPEEISYQWIPHNEDYRFLPNKPQRPLFVTNPDLPLDNSVDEMAFPEIKSRTESVETATITRKIEASRAQRYSDQPVIVMPTRSLSFESISRSLSFESISTSMWMRSITGKKSKSIDKYDPVVSAARNAHRELGYTNAKPKGTEGWSNRGIPRRSNSTSQLNHKHEEFSKSILRKRPQTTIIRTMRSYFSVADPDLALENSSSLY
jgi:hypothetical protein